MEQFSLDNKSADKKTTWCKKCMASYKKNRKKQEIVAFDYYE